MPRVTFASSIQRHVDAAPGEFPGATVREVLENAFAARPGLRGYVLDDQGHVRKHVAVFVGGASLADPIAQSDAVEPTTAIHVIQALSGG